MATPNLQITHITAAQNSKEVTANAAFDALDAAMNDGTTKVITGSTSLTTAETRNNGVVRLTGTPGASFTLNMPDTNKRIITVRNETDGDCTLRNSAGGGTTASILVGQSKMVWYDGTDLYVLSQLDNDYGPYILSFSVNGSPSATQRMTKHVAPITFEFADELAGSVAHGGTAATSSTNFDVQKNGSSIGTINFAAAANTATFTTAGSGVESFAVGDRLEVFAPGTPDATLADIGFTLYGRRT